jgi:tRNA A37 threonylcarbamoyladenosine modification protein TsaB
MPIIEIKLKERIMEIYLKNDRKVLDMITFPEKGDLTEKLLPMIDRLIEKNKLQIKDIQKIAVKSDLKEPFTSYRILKTVEKTFNFFK